MTFNTEKESIDYLISRLEAKGWEDINPTQSSDQFCYYDIEAAYKGKNVRIECKRRRMQSDKYKDAIIEKYKYDKFIEGMRHGEFDEGFLVCFFDDCFTISNIKNPINVDFCYANKTTDFSNNKVVEKIFVYYKQDKKFNYE